MVHQHFMLIPVMTVAENIVLADRADHGGVLLDIARARAARQEISRRASASPSTPARGSRTSRSASSSASRSSRRSTAAPTSSSSTSRPRCSRRRRRRSSSRSSAKLDGAGQVDHLHQPQAQRGARDRRPDHGAPPRQADRDAARAGATEESLARLMVGREVLLRVEKTPAQPAEPLLEVEDLSVFDDRGIEKVRGVSFEVRAGEIVGIAGVDGNGQTELIDAIDGPARGRRRDGARRRRGRHASDAARRTSRPGSATSRRTGSAAGSCSSSRSPRTWRSTTTARARLALRLALPAPAGRACAAA